MGLFFADLLAIKMLMPKKNLVAIYEHLFILGCHPELIVERVMPDFLHVIPVGHNAMLNGILERQHSTFALGLVTHVAVLLIHPNHDPRHLRSANDGREDGTRSVITGKTCFAHTRAVVHHERCNLILLSHLALKLRALTALLMPWTQNALSPH